MNDRIYMIGGANQYYSAWYYTISTNTWSSMYHGGPGHPARVKS